VIGDHVGRQADPPQISKGAGDVRGLVPPVVRVHVGDLSGHEHAGQGDLVEDDGSRIPRCGLVEGDVLQIVAAARLALGLHEVFLRLVKPLPVDGLLRESFNFSCFSNFWCPAMAKSMSTSTFSSYKLLAAWAMPGLLKTSHPSVVRSLLGKGTGMARTSVTTSCTVAVPRTAKQAIFCSLWMKRTEAGVSLASTCFRCA